MVITVKKLDEIDELADVADTLRNIWVLGIVVVVHDDGLASAGWVQQWRNARLPFAIAERTSAEEARAAVVALLKGFADAQQTVKRDYPGATVFAQEPGKTATMADDRAAPFRQALAMLS